MTEIQFHQIAVACEYGLGLLTFVSLFFLTAPYGRHLRGGWGPTLPSRVGWILMESPAVLLFAAIVWFGSRRTDLLPLLFVGLWLFHYLYRTFVFPFRMKADGKRMPIFIVLTAIVFNSLNAYVNARYLSHFGSYDPSWLTDPRFLGGVVLFFLGFSIHAHADTILLNLRAPGETGYKIPYGGLYKSVSCPNYFGEILQWTGWAIATWSFAGLSFAFYTLANLLPRALDHHRWYQKTFDAYPKERKAIFPRLL